MAMLRRFWVATLALMACGTVRADPSAWQEWAFPDRKSAEFSVTADGTISVHADSAVSLLYREVRDDEQASRLISWRWRVDQAPPPTDLTTAGADDRALAVHVWFPPKDDTWSVMGTLGSLVGLPVPGNAITYVWGGAHPPQTLLENPHLDNGVLIILRDATAETGTWLEETVDIDADFARAFGQPPERRPYYTVISADSDDTDSVIRAYISNMQFSDAPLPHDAS